MNSPGYDFLSTIAYIKDREMTLSVAKERTIAARAARSALPRWTFRRNLQRSQAHPYRKPRRLIRFISSFLLFGRHHRVAARLTPRFENTNKDLPTRLARFQFPESTTRNIAFS
jgi:hypothetical protein